ncbi:MAG TPA: glucuronate isomerase, partial [Planctomycetota bacterium]|nr:glucuronate isomerase [Planctomycetota bacterium]
MATVTSQDLRGTIDRAMARAKITDIHTHLYAPSFGDLLSWGIDELLTYHYLIAEYFRQSELPYEAFWKLPKREQADAIWKALFIDSSPVSEACRGVVTVLNALGLDVGRRDLSSYRKFFSRQSRESYIDLVFKKAGIQDCVMTNDPFDDVERQVWLRGYQEDPRFKAALRIDPVLLGWGKAWRRLQDWGYRTEHRLTPRTLKEIQRFFREWAQRTGALYVGVSLPPSFAMPAKDETAQILERALLPVCEELNLPLALMIGVKRQVNPQLRMAGDGMGRGSVEAVEHLCSAFPRNKFMVTMLSRENQHQLCVAARKFRNLLVFGCWWFVNNPSIIEEMTRERLELLGTSMVPQHSDARVIDQVIYKWGHSKRIIGDVLAAKYGDLLASGWALEEGEVQRDVDRLFGGNF